MIGSAHWQIWVVAVGACVAITGCSPAGDTGARTIAAEGSQANQRGPAIEFSSDPNPPASGTNAIAVTVRGEDRLPVTDAKVTVSFSMPAMPSMNMPAMRSTTTLVHASEGRYRGTLELSMAGTWNVAITVLRGPQEIASRTFSVVAK